MLENKILICVQVELPEDADTFMGVEVYDCDGGHGTVVLAVDPDDVDVDYSITAEIERSEAWGATQYNLVEEIGINSCTWNGYDVHNLGEVVGKLLGKEVTWH